MAQLPLVPGTGGEAGICASRSGTPYKVASSSVSDPPVSEQNVRRETYVSHKPRQPNWRDTLAARPGGNLVSLPDRKARVASWELGQDRRVLEVDQ